MSISFGEMVIGKVSRTKRRHYIATKFFHICDIPLTPLESFIFTGAYTVSIGLDGLSVLTGYLRTALVMATALAVFGGLIQLGSSNRLHPEFTRYGYESLITGAVFAACLAATYYFSLFTTASPAKEAWINGRLAKVRAQSGDGPIVVPPGMDAAAGDALPDDAQSTDATPSDSTPNVDDPFGPRRPAETDEVPRAQSADTPIDYGIVTRNRPRQ